MHVVLRIIYNLLQSSHQVIKNEMSSDQKLKIELKQMIKLSIDRTDYKSHIYLLGIFSALSKLCPNDIMLCEVFNYLISIELTLIKSKQQELSFLYSPVYVDLTSFLQSSIPLLNEDHFKLLIS